MGVLSGLDGLWMRIMALEMKLIVLEGAQLKHGVVCSSTEGIYIFDHLILFCYLYCLQWQKETDMV